MDDTFAAYREKAKTAAHMEEIAFSETLSAEEWGQAQTGFRPRDMDDKWRIGFHAPFLEFYRSWTSTLVFKLKVNAQGDVVTLGPLYAARDVDWYAPHADWDEVSMVKKVMLWTLGLQRFASE